MRISASELKTIRVTGRGVDAERLEDNLRSLAAQGRVVHAIFPPQTAMDLDYFVIVHSAEAEEAEIEEA